MPIEAIVSSSPCLEFDKAPLPEPGTSWLADMRGPERSRCWWVVPTSRRKRQIVREHTGRLPRTLTIENLIEHLAASSLNQRAFLGNTGRLLRIARAWSETHLGSPLNPGRVVQLDRIAAEWRESGEAPPADHPHVKFLTAFAKSLDKEGITDRPGWIETLAKEIEVGKGPLPQMVSRAKCIVFDGFHHFTGEELHLLDALAKHTTVRLWLVGEAGQSFHPNVQGVLDRFKIAIPPSVARSLAPLPALGQSLFRTDASVAAGSPVEFYETAKATAEVEAVARRIKELHRSWGAGARLADIAVVVPDDSYISLLRSAFATAGIACTPAAETFALNESRPARLLLAALRLVRHQWPADALFDFLRQPLIYRKLEPRYRLDQLQKLSPKRARPTTWEAWKNAWSQAIARWEATRTDEENEREEDPEKRLQIAAELRSVVESIDAILKPIRQLEQEIKGETLSNPKKLTAAIGRLLDEVGLHDWLSPASRANWDLVPPREWEIDQQAFNNLKDVLAELAEAPAKDFAPDLAAPIGTGGGDVPDGRQRRRRRADLAAGDHSRPAFPGHLRRRTGRGPSPANGAR